MASLMLFVGLSLFSCSDDGGGGSTGWDNDGTSGGGTSLVGTTWKFNYSDYNYKKREGGGLRFVSSSTVVVFDWEYENNDTEYVEDVEGTFSYEYNHPNGIIYANNSTATFTVSGNRMTLYGDETIILTRE